MLKRSRTLPFAIVVAFALVAAACGSSSKSGSGSTTTTPGGTSASVPSGPELKVGAQGFSESKILAQVYGQVLAAKGYKVKYVTLSGNRAILYSAFKSGDINFTPEYAASALEYLNKNAGEATPDAQQTTAKLNQQLQSINLQAFTASPARDSNAFVVTKVTADKYHLVKISDLAPVASKLKFGGPPDCPTNPFCIPGMKQRYGIDLSGNFKAFDSGGPLTRNALKSGAIDLALLFSTDGAIAEQHWVELQDDKGLINADNIVPVLSTSVASAYGSQFQTLVDQVSAAITTQELTAMNKRADIDKEDPDTIAKDFVTQKHLI